MHFMTEDKFEWAKKRWEEAKPFLDDPKLFDQGIVDALRNLNEIPGLTTIWSCQGHPKSDTGKAAIGHIIIGVKDQHGLDNLYEFYRNTARNFGPRHCNRVSLFMTQRRDLSIVHQDEDEGAWWNVWIINWPVWEGKPEFYYDKVNQAAYDTLY